MVRVDIDGHRPLMVVSAEAPTADGPVDLLGPVQVRGTTTAGDGRWLHLRCDDTGDPRFSVLDLALRLSDPPTLNMSVQTPAGATAHALQRRLAAFRAMSVEIDQAGVQLDAQYDTALLPDKPDDLQDAVLDIVEAFARAGVDVRIDAQEPLAVEADPTIDGDPAWDDIELHDAMAVSWQAFGQGPAQWKLWLLAARQHEEGRELGGVMFDGPDSPDAAQRQGAAVFLDAYMHTVGGYHLNVDSEEAARRSRLFTVIHEIGHALNLAHSWEKNAVPWEIPDAHAWRPRPGFDRPPSWMGYPHEVEGFWQGFGFGFDDDELRFLRHAPERFVRMGGTPFFVGHGLRGRGGRPQAERPRSVDVAIHPQTRSFDWLQPVRLAVRLSTLDAQPVDLPGGPTAARGAFRALVEDPDGQVRAVRPFTRRLDAEPRRPLAPGDSRWTDLFIGASPGQGSHFPQPGDYRVQVLMVFDGAVQGWSEPTTVHILGPDRADLRELGADWSDEYVGRLQAFEGSRVLTRPNRLLDRIVGRLPQGSRAWRHARLLQGTPLDRARRVLTRAGLQWRPADTGKATRAYLDFLSPTDDSLESLSTSGRVTDAAIENPALVTRVLKRLLATRMREDADLEGPSTVGRSADRLAEVLAEVGGDDLAEALLETVRPPTSRR